MTNQAAGPGQRADLNNIKNIRKCVTRNTVEKFEPGSKSSLEVATCNRESVKMDSSRPRDICLADGEFENLFCRIDLN